MEAQQALTCNTNTGVRIDPQELKSTESLFGDSGVKKITGGLNPQPPSGKSDPAPTVSEINGDFSAKSQGSV